MKPKKIDGVEVWKELEDELAPRLKLNVIDRTVYAHLLRHSRLEGKRRLWFSVPWLARQVRLSRGPVRASMGRLADHGALRLIERGNLGHLVEVRLPREVSSARRKTEARSRTSPPAKIRLEQIDFLRTRALRQAIHARESGLCFYCRKRTPGRSHCLDHVIPRANSGQNSYRNLVSCCLDCNSRKKDRPATDFLRELYREGTLSRKDLSARLRALQDLKAGKLRPQLSGAEDTRRELSGWKREEGVGGERRGPACHRSASAEPRTEKR